jgi:hypothetical protein
MDKLLVSDYMKNNKCNSSSGLAKKSSRRRSVKAMNKKSDKLTKVIESQVFDKIKEIKIGEEDILNLTRNPSSLEFNKKGMKNVGW